MTNSTHNSLDARISLVRDRLEFVQVITDLNPQFLDPSLIKHTSNGGCAHPWKHFDALRNYLLLTCFDLLGQPDEWMDFNSWLKSKKHCEEVSQAISQIDGAGDSLELIKAVNLFYTKKFGVKNSFYRFINNVLPAEVKTALLYSIQISSVRTWTTGDSNGAEELQKIEDDDSKIKFLYWIRNAYTHKAISTGSPAGGIWKNGARSQLVNGVEMHGWLHTASRQEGEKDHYTYGAFRKWPEVLIETVEAGLTRVIELPMTL